MNGDWPSTPIIIVSYRTPDDVVACLRSLDRLQADPEISVHICENGGAADWDDLCASLLQPDGPCASAEDMRRRPSGSRSRPPYSLKPIRSSSERAARVRSSEPSRKHAIFVRWHSGVQRAGRPGGKARNREVPPVVARSLPYPFIGL